MEYWATCYDIVWLHCAADIIDPAILRPGRLDKVLYVGLPSCEGRAAILRAVTKVWGLGELCVSACALCGVYVYVCTVCMYVHCV